MQSDDGAGSSSGGGSSNAQKASGSRVQKVNEKIILNTTIPRLRNDLDRPSALVRINAPDFQRQFRVLWDEHVEGFTGLRGKRRERTEKEQNMEWRIRLKEKREREKHLLNFLLKLVQARAINQMVLLSKEQERTSKRRKSCGKRRLKSTSG